MELLHDSTPISGTSAGALAAAFVISGMSHHDCAETTQHIQKRLLKSGYCWKVVNVLQEALDEILPGDAHLKATGHIGIGVTVYAKKNGIKGRVLSQFASRQEFIDAVTASCYIPYYLGPRLGIEWPDGSIYSDGMPTNFFPNLPSESRSCPDNTITVSAFPAANRRLFDARNVDISPDRRPASEIPGVWKTVWNGLVPLRTEEVEQYRQKGYTDTLLWAKQSSSVTTATRHNPQETSLPTDI